MPSTSPNGTGYDSLRLISAVCNDYEHVPIGISLVAISTISDPQQVDNGFSAEQDRWIIATMSTTVGSRRSSTRKESRSGL
ncbi:MAG: hypothetical protein Q8P67_14315 [archaeon]|nr:hypothetical protein [archaeon]